MTGKVVKLLIIALIVTLNCSRLSSAPTDSNDIENKAQKENSVNDEHVPYITNNDELGSQGVIYEFRRSIKSDNTEIEARRRSALDKGFMRFGRGGTANVLRFGRSLNDEDNEKDEKMRFRRGNSNMMRFGRSFDGEYDYEPQESYEEDEDVFSNRPVLRSADNEKGEKTKDTIGRNGVRFGRYDPDNDDDDAMLDVNDLKAYEKRSNMNPLRFGKRNPKIRFGKRANNFMRFGRPDMMFNRDLPGDLMFDHEVKRGGKNMMRLGRGGTNMMRFGRNEVRTYEIFNKSI